ncbi:MAG TPA: hypothetical protein VFI18_03560 [Gaiellales bacterium]|nr:hypothetical protein [Gaiellales bacterium]
MRSIAVTLAVAAALVAPSTAQAAKDPVIPRDDLHAIRALLDEFVPDAVARKDPGAAYGLAAPSMRTGTLRDDWNRGVIPVVPYPARLGGYGIRALEVSPDHVLLDLMLQPRAGSTAGAIIYRTEVARVGGRWLVASMAPAAQFSGGGAPPKVTAAPDFGPGRGDPGTARLSQHWILIPMAVLGLPLGAGLIALATMWFRSRRARPSGDARASIPWR